MRDHHRAIKPRGRGDQTPDYAREILGIRPEATADEVQEALDGRMKRQEILVREAPPPPRIWAVLTEHVLTMDIGNPAVMLAQVERIAELARLPRINIQVLPAGRLHSGWRGAFAIAETASSPAIVYLENASEGQTVEDPDMSESRRDRVAQVQLQRRQQRGLCRSRRGGPVVVVRDTRDRAGAVLAFGVAVWARFAATVRDAGKA